MAGGAISAPALRERISRFLINPWTGLPVLAVVLYLAFYQVVGVFGAGTLVGWIEEGIFGNHVNPYFQGLFDRWVPWEWLRKLFVGDYGVLTLGITYALALVLPIVSLFFLVFSLVEDSGYFPRLALLVDRLFKSLGLNGRAVIPMILGFGCDTMATITARTLETKRERVITTLLLSLAIPCSAQLGLITGILGSRGFGVFAFYGACLFLIFMLVGWLTSQVLPGRSATFHMELPPLRLPRMGNVLRKSFSRMRWYFMEVIPLFLVASVILWALDLSGALHWIQRGMEPLMGMLGLPVTAAESFLIGFFRRDFAAAGLFELASESPSAEVLALSTRQLLVASVTLTLFVPCVAQFMMMWKERGPRTALAIFAFVTVFAFAVGTGLHHMLDALGWF
jgi:ferrous iron transport protein B